jgi:hypothetical protein
MDTQFVFPASFILIIAGVAFTRNYLSRKAVVKRKLKKAAGKKISSFLSGDIAKVVGNVEFVGAPLTSPLSGRRCAYYYVLVEQLVSTGKSSHWKKVIEEEVGGTFVIRDGRYRAHISSESTLKTYLVQDRVYSSGFHEDATEVLESYLHAHNVASENLFGLSKTLRYKEGVLEESECMAVIGRGEWKNAREISLPDSFGRILVLSSTEEEPIYLSDDPETVETTYNDLPEADGVMKS